MKPREVCGPTTPRQPWLLVALGQAYLNLQQVIAANALVVHLVVGVVSIATALILDESEPAGLLEPGACAQGRRHSQARGGRARGRNVAADEATVP